MFNDDDINKRLNTKSFIILKIMSINKLNDNPSTNKKRKKEQFFRVFFILQKYISTFFINYIYIQKIRINLYFCVTESIV